VPSTAVAGCLSGVAVPPGDGVEDRLPRDNLHSQDERAGQIGTASPKREAAFTMPPAKRARQDDPA
jgi:hypothetical protein